MKKSLLQKIIQEEVRAALGEAMAFGGGEAAKEIYNNPKVEDQLSRISGYESISPGETKEEVYIYFNKESGAKLAVKALEKLVPGPTYEYYKENEPGYSQPMFVIAVPGKNKLGEASNPELDRTVGQFVGALAKKYSYSNADAVMAIFEALKRLGMLDKSSNYKAPPAGMANIPQPSNSIWNEGAKRSKTKK
jgi:hypothetical protein